MPAFLCLLCGVEVLVAVITACQAEALGEGWRRGSRRGDLCINSLDCHASSKLAMTGER